jgi:hypothetical protein
MAGNVLREIIASFGFAVDTKELDKGEKHVEGFKETILELGKTVLEAFAVEKVLEFGKEMINTADETREASIALGLSAQQLQQLEFAASTAGLEVGELHASLARLNRVAAESAAGKGQSGAFKKLGIDLKNADGTLKTSGELFEAAGVAIGEIENPTERAGVASEIFGKSYAKLLPLFAEGQEGIDKLKKEAEDLGLVFDEAFMENADAFNDNLKSLHGGLRGLAIEAIGPLLPDLVALAKGAVSVTKEIVYLAKHTKVLQVVFGLLAAKGIGLLIGPTVNLLSKFTSLKGAVTALRTSVLPLLIAFALLEDVFVFLTGGKSVTGAVFDKIFGKGTTKQIQEIVAAFLGADNKIGLAFWGLALALKIVWTEIKYAALLAGAAIEDGFDKVWNGIVDGAEDALKAMGELLANVPGLSDLKTGIAAGIKDLEGLKLKGGNADAVRAERDRERLRIAEEGDQLKKAAEPVAKAGDRLTGAAGELSDAAGHLRGASGGAGGTDDEPPPTVTPPEQLTPRQRKIVAGYDKIAHKFEPKKPSLPVPAGVKPKVAKQFDAFAATFDTPKAVAPPGGYAAPYLTNVNAPANVVQNFYVQGAPDKATVPTLRKQMKEGANQALNLRAAQAALTRGSGG